MFLSDLAGLFSFPLQFSNSTFKFPFSRSIFRCAPITMEQVPLAVRMEKDGRQVAQVIVTAPLNSTFQSITDRVIRGMENKDQKIVKIYTGSKSMDQKDLFEVDPTTILGDAVRVIGTCTKILCKLKSTLEPPEQPKNAFQQMMKNAAAAVYPS